MPDVGVRALPRNIPLTTPTVSIQQFPNLGPSERLGSCGWGAQASRLFMDVFHFEAA